MYVKRTVIRRLDDVRRILTGVTSKGGDIDHRYFTRTELEYCTRRLRSLGARLLIKECVLDHLGTAFGPVEKRYGEIEIVNDAQGKPVIRLSARTNEYARRIKIRDIRVSISHSRGWIATMLVFCYQHGCDRLSGSQGEASF